jgi:amino acid permease
VSKKSASLGVGRLLIAVYAVFAVSATARALFQILTKFEEAPLATVSLAKSGKTWRKVATYSVAFELVGVVSIGSLSFVVPELFAHSSVWSGFGSGYGFLPLALPILGLVWINRSGKGNSSANL